MFVLFLKRFLYSIPTLFLISILVFMIIRVIPGDPVDFMLGEKGASPQMRQAFEERLGLDKPVLYQYALFLGRALKGDFGESIVSGQKVSSEFSSLFPATIELALSSLLLAILLGVPLGFLSALKQNSLIDRVVIGSSLIGYSMSIFWWGLVLILFFSVTLEWTPISGRIGFIYEVTPKTGFMFIDALMSSEPWEALKSFLQHLILPTLTLTTIPLVYILRMTRSSMIEAMKEDFVRTAKAKGLGFYVIVFKHAFRNAMLPIVTIIGFMLGSLLTGAVLTEMVFSWPGIGRWMLQAVHARDYPVLQGGILFIAVCVLIVNLFVDMAYLVIDPRVRKSE